MLYLQTRKKMHFNQDYISEFSKQGFLSGSVLQRYQLDAGIERQHLLEVCRRRGINSSFILELMKAFEYAGTYSKSKFEQYSVPVIIDYLRRTHHLYLTKKLPEIEQSINHLVYGYQYYQPYLVAVQALFARYRQNLVEHIEVEEKQFFPHALYLYDRSYRGGCINKLHKKLRKYSVNDFLHHHDDTETELSMIMETINKYRPSQMEESLYRLLKSQITAFVHDLYIHAMIEDEVLVPKVAKLEKKAIGNQLNLRLKTGVNL